MGECGGNLCTAEERCDANTLLCVNDDAPVIAVTPRSGVVSTPTFELTGTIKDDVKVTAATWRIGTGAATPISIEPDGSFVITVAAPLLDSQDVVVTLRAQDQRTEATVEVSVKIDRVGPSFRVVRPVVGSLIGTANFELAVETTDGSGAVSTLRINQASITAPQSGAQVVQTIDVPVTANGTPLEFELLATDAAGNQRREFVQFIGDRVAPEVAFVIPTPNQYVVTERFTVVVSVVEPSPISSAAFQFGGATVVGSEVSPGQWSAELTTAIVEQDQLISVDVTDAAGNATTVQTTVKVDRIAPTLSVTSPASASIHRAAIPLTVSTSQGTSEVTAVLEGQQVALTGGPTSWTGSLPIPQRDFSAAMVQVTARDLAGNSRVVTVPISVDTVAPVVAFTAPSAGQKFNAAQFVANPNVTVTWTVTDADAQAATTSINGSAGSATTRQVATSATDNPTTYATTVVGADRAGNTTTASLSFSADRVIPTITNWEPAANARNLERSHALITFSEPVFGAQATTPGLVISGFTPVGDEWFVVHSWYRVPLDGLAGRVLEASVPALADAHGNPVAPSTPRRFHMATTIPEGVLATNVSTFSAASDADGALTVAYIDATTRQVHVLQDRAGTLTPTTLSGFGTKVTVNASNVVNPTTLASTPSFGVSLFDSLVNAYKFFWSVDGTVTSVASSFAGVAIGQGPLNREPTTAATGYVVNSTYTRGAHTVTLPSPANMVVANSPDSWVVVFRSGSTMSWSRYRCNRDPRIFPGPDTFTCAGTEYRGSLSAVVPYLFEAAMTRSGGCLLISAPGAGGSLASFYQRLDNCDGSLGVSPPASCNSNTSMTNSPGYIDQRIAPFAANGEDTILFAFPANNNIAGDFRLEKMLPGVCAHSTTFNTIVNVPNVREYAPIQIGNRAALITVNTSNQLRIDYP